MTSSYYEIQRDLQALREKVARLTSLIEVSIIVNSTLDLDEVLNLVMEKAQSVMRAEACSIMIINEKTNLLECEVALGVVGDQIKKKVQLKLGQGITGWVAKTGEPLNVPDVSQDGRFYAEPDKITGFTTRSILAVPLKVKNKVIGVAEVINPLYGDSFTEDDLELFSTFGRQVALAIENARMHRQMLDKQKLEQQLESAFSIQQSFMPQTFPRCSQGRFTVWARYLPATSIGGDFYDFIEFEDDYLGVVIGDVSGKGIPAALYMARLVSDFRFHSQLEREPTRTLKAINELLVARSRRGMFVTLQYLILEPATGNLKITNAGHLPPIWLHQNGYRAAVLDDIEGAPLGIKVGLSFCSRELKLNHGDSILLFTDGIIEAKNKKGNRFSMKQLLQISRGNWENPQRLVDTIIGSVSEFSRGVPQHDDITVVALTWH